VSGVQDSQKDNEEARQLALTSEGDPDLAPREARLEELERGIERRYIEIGLALQEISEKKLYKLRGQTWKQYVEERWEISREHADRLRRAARLAQEKDPRVLLHRLSAPRDGNSISAAVGAPGPPQAQTSLRLSTRSCVASRPCRRRLRGRRSLPSISWAPSSECCWRPLAWRWAVNSASGLRPLNGGFSSSTYPSASVKSR
jgi:hypothetical protein